MVMQDCAARKKQKPARQEQQATQPKAPVVEVIHNCVSALATVRL
jgi:hypothetical protein